MIVTDRESVPKPPCPQCGTPLNIDWHEVTTWGGRPKYMPGRMQCPENEDHDVRAACVELDWPTSMTEEDRAWMRQHGTLPECP